MALSIMIKGVVQGVGFRPFVHTLALGMGLSGTVRNTDDGVLVEVQGAGADEFASRLRAGAPPLARIDSIDERLIPNQLGRTGFSILESTGGGSFTMISPDVAMCADCARELADPADRRHGYPFINCTNCGPRYSITYGVPYDRPNTVMRRFTMCPACLTEYENPSDRRFHAVPNACPDCGPRVWFAYRHGAEAASGPAAIEEARQRLARGEVLAIKGLGGFHLCCDASNNDAVMRLRERKRRSNKPFALMARGMDVVRHHCAVSADEEKLLEDRRRPIVLLRRLDGAEGLSAAVAPGNARVGFMLPYTPLHALLFEDGLEALVMTSGNLSEEPIQKDNDEAVRKLGPLVEGFLLHDRGIFMRVDDPVVMARPKGRGALMIRRSRGYAPEAIALRDAGVRLGADAHDGGSSQEHAVCNAGGIGNAVHADGGECSGVIDGRDFSGGAGGARESALLSDAGAQAVPETQAAPDAQAVPEAISELSILAAGADLKSAPAITRGGYVIPAQHIGDLENLEAMRFFEETLGNLMAVYNARPVAVAHDLHPDYMSTRWALSRGLPALAVQHHHAHIASVMAEHGLCGPVLGLAFDGTGLGTDGTIWGSEFLRVDEGGFERLGRFAPSPMPGGDRASREPWRMALSLILRSMASDEALRAIKALGYHERIGRDMVEGVLKIIGRPEFSPLSSGLGRVFDAVASICGVCHVNTFEAEAAIALESLAAGVAEPYGYEIKDDGLMEISLAPAVRSIIDDVLAGRPASHISGRFHATVIEGAFETARRLAGDMRDVCLSGGVFQNALLLEGLWDRFEGAGFRVYANRAVPVNDACISVGQAHVLSGMIRKGWLDLKGGGNGQAGG